MTTFLATLAQEYFVKAGDDLEQYTFVFPNKRAGLFFKDHLLRLTDKPIWSPTITSIETYFLSQSPLQQEEPLGLILELYAVFKEQVHAEESLDRFYFWGQMLLTDFDELDKYLVRVPELFTAISEQKRIDQLFGGLSEEQVSAIRQFWNSFEPPLSEAKQEFHDFWNKLSIIYQQFNKQLTAKGIGYTGLIYRDLLENRLENIRGVGPVVFAGFQALTPVEESLIAHWVDQFKATIHWDLDAYYVDDENQEAGHFFRNYLRKSPLGKTFPVAYPSNIHNRENVVTIKGVAGNAAQARIAAEQVQHWLDSGINPEEIAIILPDEKLLFTVLHYLPAAVSTVNITMGYPLHISPVYSLLELFIRLQASRSSGKAEQEFFWYEPFISFLEHPYIRIIDVEAINKVLATVKRRNILSVPRSYLEDLPAEIGQLLDSSTIDNAIFGRLKQLLLLSYRHIKAVQHQRLETEFIYRTLVILKRLEETLQDQAVELDLQELLLLIRQAVKFTRIPFSGEPLKGLQVMGLLETRMLDFKYTILLSCNEEVLPEKPRDHSFIPYNLRKGVGLPTLDQYDGIPAYLFYRLLHHSQDMLCLYDSSMGEKTREISRYLSQLQLETKLVKSHEQVMVLPAALPEKEKTVRKTEAVMEKLNRFTGPLDPNLDALSPSALNSYLTSPYEFFIQHVLGVEEPDDIEDVVDSRIYGNLVHYAMEWLYGDRHFSKNEPVTAEKLEQVKKAIRPAIDHAFSLFFKSEEQPVNYAGRNIVVRDLLEVTIRRIIEKDLAYAPFEILLLEQKLVGTYLINTATGKLQIRIKGFIDRVDRKEGVVRILDYKSGKDKPQFGSLAELFDTSLSSRNKAAFQSLLYCSLFLQNFSSYRPESIRPALYSMANLFPLETSDHFIVGRGKDSNPVQQVGGLLTEFHELLGQLLEEIWDTAVPFQEVIAEPEQEEWESNQGE